jgi:hypothetical protein
LHDGTNATTSADSTQTVVPSQAPTTQNLTPFPTVVSITVAIGLVFVSLVIGSAFDRLKQGTWRERIRAPLWAAISATFAWALVPFVVFAPPYWANVGNWLVIGFLVLLGALILVPSCALLLNAHHHPCPHCGKWLAAKCRWRCGSCDHVNGNVRLTRPCIHCRRIVEAVECPFCGVPFALGDDEIHPNRVSKVVTDPIPGETDADVRRRRQLELAEREHRVRLLVIEAEIKEKERRVAKAAAEPTDETAARREWFAKELLGLEFTVKSIEMAKAEEARLAKEIDGNARLTDDQKQEFKRQLENRVLYLCERISIG